MPRMSCAAVRVSERAVGRRRGGAPRTASTHRGGDLDF